VQSDCLNYATPYAAPPSAAVNVRAGFSTEPGADLRHAGPRRCGKHADTPLGLHDHTLHAHALAIRDHTIDALGAPNLSTAPVRIIQLVQIGCAHSFRQFSESVRCVQCREAVSLRRFRD
jgi:hypothetical protein